VLKKHFNMTATPLRNIARFFFGVLLPKNRAYPIIRGPLRGTRFILGAAAGEGGGATVYFNMMEPQQTQLFSSVVKTSDTFYDIGANVGYYSLLGSRLVGDSGKVISIEPVIRNLYYLYRHIELNGVTNALLLAMACSDKTSIASFALGRNCALGRLSDVRNTQPSGAHGLAVVPTTTVDLIAEHTHLMPDVMKIDVEGAELQVLYGAQYVLSQVKPKIFLSIHSSELRTACLQHLSLLNYRIQPLNDGVQEPTEYYAYRA
jgi:FkbM family methyltransferase